jgi:hypothetical protein
MTQKLLLLCVLAVSVAHAQTASIKKVELAGEKVIVYYDLEDSNPANEYQIALYASQSNFATALTKVTGDVGNEIKAGANKKIEWKLRDEIGPYKGKLSLEIRGRVFMAVAKINSISEGDKFKRGKTHLITWRPGNTNPVNIELLKGQSTVSTQLNQQNNGSINFPIPENSKVGKDYSIRITDTKNSADFVVSQPFAVQRKIPLLLKVVPIIAVGGVVAVLAGGGGSKAPGREIELPTLPSGN